MFSGVTSTTAAAAALATAAVLAGGAIATAVPGPPGSSAARSPGVSAKGPETSWHRYHQDDVDYARGDACRFAVHGHVLRDREFYRNVNFWPHGAVRTQLYRGPLVFRWTDRATGRSVVRNQSGRAYVAYHRNGDFASLNALSGHFGAGFTLGSHPSRGLFYLGGRWTSVVVDHDGTSTLTLGPKGTAENLCRTLG